MDNRSVKILQFADSAKARIACNKIHEKRIAELETQGYTIETRKDGVRGVRGKLGLTNEDDPSPEAVTWLWDAPRTNTEGSFYIGSADGVTDAVLGLEKGKDYVEKPMPDEWRGKEEMGAGITEP